MPATLKSRLPAIAAELRPVVGVAVKEGAELVEARAAVRAPDRPPVGEGLVEAIHTERKGPTAYEVVAGDDEVFYGHMVEHGTTHSPPHPFLLPSLEESRDEITGLVRTVLGHL